MIKQLGAAVAAAAFLVLASPAPAQGAAAAQAPAAGGAITRAQGEEMVRAMFGQMDANHDGVVDQAELKTVIDALKAQGAPDAVAAHFQKMMNDADPAKTGKVGLEAFVKARLVAFDKADTNHDGKLDAAEQAAARAAAESGK